MRIPTGWMCGLLLALSIAGPAAHAEDDAASGPSPLAEGAYVAPLATAVITRDSAFSNGAGGRVAGGYRQHNWALEAGIVVDQMYGAHGNRDTVGDGGSLDGLWFPLPALPNLFAIGGVGILDVHHYPQNGREYSLITAEGGVGYLLPLSIGRYDFALRADARFRYGRRSYEGESTVNAPVPHDFEDVLINVGLQLPIGSRPRPPGPPSVAPAAVVPLAKALPQCSDGIDNDGDGAIDYPADPGCTGPDDDDERNPPQCSDGIDNDGDGAIDYPADRGCSSPEDNDETDPCPVPVAGENIRLLGCGSGDVIVLSGVTFDFDKASLTVDGRRILDGVAHELLSYPAITVEIGGHTDNRGTPEHNQRLSEQRAHAVVEYLAAKGVAAGRMQAVGYGDVMPVADNATDEGRELNRRVELRITAGTAIDDPAAPASAPH